MNNHTKMKSKILLTIFIILLMLIAYNTLTTEETKNHEQKDIETKEIETKEEKIVESKTSEILNKIFENSEVIYGKENEMIKDMFENTGLNLNVHVNEISVINEKFDYIILIEPNYDEFGAFLNGIIDFQTKISIEENPTISKKEAIIKTRENVILEQIGAYMVFIKTEEPLNIFNKIKDYLTKVG